jgi:glucose-1-phosphate cytidylyltransferase
MRNNKTKIHQNGSEPWTVTLIDTGENTMTGGRIKRVKDYIGDQTFCLTYGDGVTDANINESINFHQTQKALATLTAVQSPGRFGAFRLEQNQHKISAFKEKPKGDGAWINGGFFVLEPKAIDYIEDDSTVFERAPLENLSKADNLSAFQHRGFWMPMDTLRDRNVLEEMWNSDNPPWKVW